MKKLLMLGLSAYLFAGIISCKGIDSTTPTVEDHLSLNALNAPNESTVNVKTFNKVKNAFGDGLSQSAEGTFTLPADVSNVKTIKMFVKNECPNKTCDEWDRYANVYVKDKTSGIWYEIGRFITPYWVGTEKLPRGLEIDVTDFKSLLNGNTELKIYTETWLAKGREYSVDFDFVYGTPDYKYSAVIPVLQYNKSSIDGVPYGKAHNLKLKKNIQLPVNTESAYLRTIVSGWGHATPYDAGGRGCAEWCFRTHSIAINNVSTFQHQLGAIGCASNPINNQSPGNWSPDRAGWCPGMAVPVRINALSSSLFGNTFSYEYKFQNWTNNGSNGDAFYAISTFVIAKSNTPINSPIVTD
ncbi:peptidase [Elizabethkingia meningoseptica]|uniref:peptide-N-glycosidase F-related protein n=1 Tax=Elizabethkingia meningoseptica TaxID=238 RepID=UPI0023B09DB7|nr:peptide-N-glycosidase F-related protein [Elizabethkingia meningoseptica]MDE5430617.1 peptidase [Elizabethkingia meningoseptica]MDE5438661.1 peptidase [Elizabethkingia meningoseptica]MDE5469284.1 peptidase [Elizabethkingia meningoseptica]MDE5475198.1 peptidase [Elizabethkingia meningoseptica]MDE5478631.1 peptidase [Elizabethkingia meningoseptica]